MSKGLAAMPKSPGTNGSGPYAAPFRKKRFTVIAVFNCECVTVDSFWFVVSLDCPIPIFFGPLVSFDLVRQAEAFRIVLALISALCRLFSPSFLSLDGNTIPKE